jgi:hypothetical protein
MSDRRPGTLRQFDRVVATLRPVRTDDLRPGIAAYVGITLEWEALWVIEEGPYKGQWAIQPSDMARWPFRWFPQCDLEIVPEG